MEEEGGVHIDYRTECMDFWKDLGAGVLDVKEVGLGAWNPGFEGGGAEGPNPWI